ncbi:MAG: tetratricopeptide repeat protein, partial [Planctomycetes bacterium]|nr:tetratricopeptide repeat protein [Planctomycetota bacterium]
MACSKHALSIRRERYGEKHLDTAATLNNIGTIDTAMGEYKLAQEYNEQALQIQTELLGEKHPDTAATLNDIGA